MYYKLKKEKNNNLINFNEFTLYKLMNLKIPSIEF